MLEWNLSVQGDGMDSAFPCSVDMNLLHFSRWREETACLCPGQEVIFIPCSVASACMLLSVWEVSVQPLFLVIFDPS